MTAADVLEQHNFGGDRLLKLARRIANDELRRRGAFLDHDRLEDLVAFLALAGVRAAVTYDPAHRQVRYGQNGGRDSFSSYLADVMAYRVTDFYRTKANGFCDRRYWGENPIVLDGEMKFSEPGDAFEREVALRRAEERTDYDEAEAEIASRVELSPTARAGLRLIRLRVEGYEVGGPGTMTAQRIAREELAASSPSSTSARRMPTATARLRTDFARRGTGSR